ncbi:cytochrome P450 [Mycena filopes]|nr:cytochrome P450 [Mycena filopes]
MVDNIQPTAIGFAVVTIILLVWLLGPTKRFPPSPSGVRPIIGHALVIPRTEPWKIYKEWSDTLGPVFSFRIFTRRVIVLNTTKSVLDLLDKRAKIYSDRPRSWMYHEVVDRKLNVFSVSPQNERFKKYRRLLNSGLNPRATQSYQNNLETEAVVLLRALTERPDKFLVHIRRHAGTVILKIGYGYTVVADDDPFIKGAEDTAKIASEIIRPGRWLVDDYRFLRHIPAWLPGGGFKRAGAKFRVQLDNFSRAPHKWIKNQIAQGKHVDCFSSRLLLPEDGHKINEEEDDVIHYAAAALFGGAADTTVSVVSSFFLLMSLHPEIQKRAQEEVNSVTGGHRLPTFDDLKSFLLASAIVKEILRWAPVAPLGLTHSVTQDDEYNGHFIPRGALLVPNIWAMMHDASVYPDPFTFNPDRFIPSNGHEGECQPDPTAAFGFGYRVCPGAHFAQTSILLTITSILAVFRIEKFRDETGKEVEPDVGYTTGLTSHSKPFKCRIVPRSEEALALLR